MKYPLSIELSLTIISDNTTILRLQIAEYRLDKFLNLVNAQERYGNINDSTFSAKDYPAVIRYFHRFVHGV